jgi:glycosyltransferase involved in cell wall biosynthesis
MHVVESAGGSEHLWGKENVVSSLMEAQRASGAVEPELVTFTPCALAFEVRNAGFKVNVLELEHRRVPIQGVKDLAMILSRGPKPVVHTHEYKANIVGRILRATGTPMKRLVSTCHGWVDRSPQLDMYFAVDRLTAFGSDVVTVTDPAMIKKFSPLLRYNLKYIQNGVKSLPLPTHNELMDAKNKFGFPSDAIVIGSLGRLTKNKGILDILEAARRTQDNKQIIWVIAGSGALKEDVEQCDLPNVRYVGYQSDSVQYLNALDVYLQASHFEGLSLSLLESMRNGLPSISTKAGATELAVRDGKEALLVDAGNIDALVGAAAKFARNSVLRAGLGSSARLRFVEKFSIEQQHVAFYKLYEGVVS